MIIINHGRLYSGRANIKADLPVFLAMRMAARINVDVNYNALLTEGLSGLSQ